ncbi:hypothetical protein ESCO_004895 [Escovopsis weberi]|uniref:Uncharacterized protein n=1 Tax=Escovopsis weberi TaxID=150374 RepID=A0A0M8MPU5_ESCWE|nr:hypothetical protein ESCO_004895 [Escovopsis weberi]
MAEAASSPLAANSAGSSKKKEDVELLKARLADQFNPRRYRNPMVPREAAGRESWPAGVTPEMVEGWLAKIQAAK